MIEIIAPDFSTELKILLAENGISAGFPSPAIDFMNKKIDLNEFLIKNKSTTFYGIVRGDSMIDAGFHDKDLLIIDKSEPLINNNYYVCFVDDGFTLKMVRIEKKEVWLIPANEKYSPVQITEENDFMIWGKVTFQINKPRYR